MTLDTHAESSPATTDFVRPRIMVAVDGGAASRAALRWTAERAGQSGAVVRLVTVVDKKATEEVASTLSHALLGSRIVMETIAENSDIDTVLRRGDAAHELVEAAAEFGAELLVIGTHATARYERSTMGTVPGRLASTAHCPVAVVPVDWMPVSGPVVVGWSNDSASTAAVEFAVSDARAHDDAVVLAHVWDLPTTGQIPVSPGGPESIPDRQKRFLENTAAEVARSWPGLLVRAELLHGRPVEQLKDAAAHARVLVVGRRARTSVSRLVLGSVSRGLLSAPPCPVVIMPTPAVAVS
ncbi:MAG: universal stress protein [Pseudolysinimonas sp.]